MKAFNGKNLVYIFVCVTIVWLGFLLGDGLPVRHNEPPKVRVTVFIHGTVGTSFNVLNPWKCSSETFDKNCLSARTVKRFRSFDGMNYDQIFGPHGLTEFNAPDLPVWYASRYVIPAYQVCSECVGVDIDIYKHALFGWTGFLHNGARKEAGYELYQALCDYRDSLVMQYNIDPEIDIVAHSHGGNVALWLAQAEKEYKRGLLINTLIMLGTPMQKEMTLSIASPLFRTMVLCYSQGDSIQQRDYFSAKEGKSYQQMAHIANIADIIAQNPSLRRHDVACIVNNNDQRITHTNMWLAGRSNPVLDDLDPLPLVVFMPALVWCLDQHPKDVAHELFISDSGDSCNVALHPGHLICHTCKNSELLDGKALRKRLCVWSHKMRAEWQASDDTSRHVFFNRKNIQALKHAIWG